MTPIERAQAVALLSGAEAMKSQSEALHALAMAQIAAANALLGAESPTPMVPLTRDALVGERPLYYGKHANGQPSQE